MLNKKNSDFFSINLIKFISTFANPTFFSDMDGSRELLDIEFYR